jgi:hypothetical protein
MSKKDFVALADALSPAYKAGEVSEAALGAIAGFCFRQNQAFMPKRWHDYLDGKCGPNGGEI